MLTYKAILEMLALVGLNLAFGLRGGILTDMCQILIDIVFELV